MPFVKLDCGMINSTIWIDLPARTMFITALLMAEPKEFTEPVKQINVRNLEFSGWEAPPGWYGFVPAAGSGIARRAEIDVEIGLSALERLGAPEGESRSQEYEGRRLVRINGGYLVLNYNKYREKDYTSADRSRRYRERKKKESSRRDSDATHRDITQAEAEAEADSKVLLGGKIFVDTKSEKRENENPPSKTLGPAAQISLEKQQDSERRMIQSVEDGETERKANFSGPELHKALYDAMRAAAYRERIPLVKAKEIFKGHFTYGQLPWIDSLDSQQEIFFPDTNGTLDLSSQDAGRSLRDLLRLSGREMITLSVAACESVKRRFPEKRYTEIPIFIRDLWQQYQTAKPHGGVAFHNWLKTIGVYLDKHWEKPKEQKREVIHTSGNKPAPRTPEWAFMPEEEKRRRLGK